MPAGLYFKLIMIVILIILDYFFPRTEIVGQVAWGWKLEPRAIKCNDDRTGTHYLITKMTQTTCRWIVSLVNSCKRGLEVKGIDLEIGRSLLYFQVCHQFVFWPSASHDCINILALIFSSCAWCEARASVYWWIWAEVVPPRLHKRTVREPKVEARSKLQWEVSAVGNLCFLGKNFGLRLESCPWTLRSAYPDLRTGHKVCDDDVKENYDGIRHLASWIG